MANSNEYMREYMKNRYAARRAEAIAVLGGKCVQCQTTSDLEIDHIDPSQKSYSMSKILNRSKALVESELAKCQILCHECHVDKHRSQAECGTTARYHAGCRCSECRRAIAAREKLRKTTWKYGPRVGTQS